MLAAYGLRSWGRTGLVALWHVEFSQTRDQAQAPCAGRQVLTTGPPGRPLCGLLSLVISGLFSGMLFSLHSIVFLI